jgi:hypothetical protein
VHELEDDAHAASHVPSLQQPSPTEQSASLLQPLLLDGQESV